MFEVISQVWHIEIRPNSEILCYLESLKNIYQHDLEINALVPSILPWYQVFYLGTKYCPLLGTKYCTLVQFGAESPTRLLQKDVR